MSLPVFIESPDTQQIPSPYHLDVRSQWYPLPADPGTLQDVCDTWLNVSPEREYKSLLALLTVNHYPRLQPTEPAFHDHGWLSAREVAWNVLAYWHRPGGWLPEGMTLFSRYIFIDNPMAAVTGLAVLGFPKQVSTVGIPEDLRKPSPTTLDTWVFKSFSPETPLTFERVMTLTASSGAGSGLAFSSFNDLVRHVFDRHRREDLEPSVIAEIHQLLELPNPVSLTCLKQFRDAADPSTACYQALVEVQNEVSPFGSGGILDGTYKVEIAPADSLPIASTLGLGNLGAVEGCWLDLRITLGPAENVYVVPGGAL